ncbi:alpha/beta hydrolase family protein [Nonomuraea basaltis]|uniref:alpha/beta hydrolase family protein n=1 Tax=Nonomuraea basaltis TaxID=2495887 RepID=UPI00110C5E5A|nr:alpha/beta hydrolase [Nonomuraea basaltis]TMR90200.1 alpha/beta hydrolase [Nonomuraea basaltis]
MDHVTEERGAARRYDAAGAPSWTGGKGEAVAVPGLSGGGRRTSRDPILRGSVVAVAGLLALVASSSTAPASASSASAGRSAAPAGTPYLPKPTGSHPVGATSLHLKDVSRHDPWVPEATARELMVSLWYPAKVRDERRAQYVTPKESELLLKDAQITGVPSDVLSKTRTNAFSDAKPAGRKRTLPLVVLSPGFNSHRSSLTALAEDLASRGYVVAGIDHTYETTATTFPDGRITTCVACETKGEDFGEKVVGSRALDVSFVLDQLTRSRSTWKGAHLIDPSRIAMAGQSVGGASSIAAMLKDSRVRAGINMDGTTFAPIPKSGLSRPFLFLGTQAMHSPGGKDRTWERDWKGLTGWKRWLVVAGAAHASFTDVPLLADQFGIDHGADLTGVRSLEITRRYVGAFLDQHLGKKPQSLLDKPSARYPEVKFCSVKTTTCR